MTLENNFINHSKEYLFLDNDILYKNREKAYNKIIQKDFDKKNNESLKNITISDVINFDYFYKPKKNIPKVSLLNKLNYEIQAMKVDYKMFKLTEKHIKKYKIFQSC